MRTLFALAVLIAIVSPAVAEDAKPTAVDQERQSLESFAAANVGCREWTDGCAVCARRENGTFACSLPGIACQPAGLTCRKTAQETKSPEKSSK